MIDTVVLTALSDRLLSRSNTDGGWSYYAGRTSRLEPTCWAVLALDPARFLERRPGAFLAACQRPAGWLVEQPQWPINVAFNALAAFTWVARRETADDAARRRLLEALVAEKGQQIPPSADLGQNNSLQAWPWIDATFSWVEPTAWGLLALKKAVRAGVLPDASARNRIDEAERLLFDRACKEGGWNFGNPQVLGTNLLPHLPTTALALLALQDRGEHPIVGQGLRILEERWAEEQSAVALGLSNICLSVYNRSTLAPQERLTKHMDTAEQVRGTRPSTDARIDAESNAHGLAVALAALTPSTHALFKI